MLVGTNLAAANLQNIVFRKAKLIRTNLSNADLRGSRIQETNLSRAYLAGANLNHATLERVDLRGANLLAACLCLTNLQTTYLNRAYLSDTNFDGATLSNIKFAGANLTRASLKNLEMEKIEFGGNLGLEEEQINYLKSQDTDFIADSIPYIYDVVEEFKADFKDRIDDLQDLLGRSKDIAEILSLTFDELIENGFQIQHSVRTEMSQFIALQQNQNKNFEQDVRAFRDNVLDSSLDQSTPEELSEIHSHLCEEMTLLAEQIRLLQGMIRGLFMDY
jgi:hypothetical protein